MVESQAILGTDPGAPAAMLASQEADLYVPDKPALSTLIDGTIGELSPFHQTFGYYGHGVGEETAVLPSDWKTRLVAICNENTNGVVGLCLHPLDIGYSKLAAGRPKDLTYCKSLLEQQYVDPRALADLINQRGDGLAEIMLGRLRRLLGD